MGFFEYQSSEEPAPLLAEDCSLSASWRLGNVLVALMLDSARVELLQIRLDLVQLLELVVNLSGDFLCRVFVRGFWGRFWGHGLNEFTRLCRETCLNG